MTAEMRLPMKIINDAAYKNAIIKKSIEGTRNMTDRCHITGIIMALKSDRSIWI